MSPFALNLEKTKIGNSLVMLEPAIECIWKHALWYHMPKMSQASMNGSQRHVLQMSNEERFRHKLVTIGFHYSVLPQVPRR